MSDDLETAIRRGERATAILADEVFTTAFATIEADLMTAWRNNPVMSGADSRENIFTMLRALDSVRAELTRVMAEGRLSEDELEDRKREAAISDIPGLTG